MANAVMTREEQQTHTIEIKENEMHITAEEITFRVPPIKHTRLTSISLRVNLPADPKHVFVQMFGMNAGVTDSFFSTIVGTTKRNLIQLDTLRINTPGDPDRPYGYDVLVKV